MDEEETRHFIQAGVDETEESEISLNPKISLNFFVLLSDFRKKTKVEQRITYDGYDYELNSVHGETKYGTYQVTPSLTPPLSCD